MQCIKKIGLVGVHWTLQRDLEPWRERPIEGNPVWQHKNKI